MIAVCHYILTLSLYSCSDSPPDLFWHFFLSPALAQEESVLIFCFLLICFTLFSSLLSDSDDVSELLLSSLDCLPFLSLFPLALAVEGPFSTAFQTWREVEIYKIQLLLIPEKFKNDFFCQILLSS